MELELIPDFLLVKNRVPCSHAQSSGAKRAAEFDWDAYYGPGAVAHRLGYAESEEDRATRVQWIRDQKERSEHSMVKFEERRLDQDDADIKQATREHEHKRKLTIKRRKRSV